MIDVTGSDAGPRAVELGGGHVLPDTLPVLPLRESVAFPDTLTPLAVGQERSVQLVNDVLAGTRMLVMVASKDPENELPGPDDLYTVGVVGAVARMLKVPDGTLRILVQGAQRVRIDKWVRETPYLIAEISELPDVVEETPELVALTRNVQTTFSQIVEEVPYLPEELQLAVANIDDPSALSHLIAGSLRLKGEEKQELLEEVDVAKRLRRLSEVLARELEVISIGSKIQSQVQSELDKSQREYFLRQQLKAIQEELGEFDEMAAEAGELREQLDAIDCPRRSAGRSIASSRAWSACRRGGRARRDQNLPGVDRLAAVGQLHRGRPRPQARAHDPRRGPLRHRAGQGPHPRVPGGAQAQARRARRILCFVGPPGVGKTSLGRSIARALGREFERISAGGVRDEAEIRGHRRTYIGAMPGTIIRALRDAGSNNPLFMIDEIDKMGTDYRGDPASAMLEVLDPEQNATFRDHYLDVPFDLSQGHVHHDRQHAGHGPAAAARPHGGHRARGLHRGGEARDRQALPGPAPDRAQRPQALTARLLRSRPAGDHLRLHARGGRAQPRARDRHRRAQDRAPRGRGRGRQAVTISERRARELLGKRRFHSEAKRRTQQPGVATGPGLDAGRRRRAVHRGDRHARAPASSRSRASWET